MTTIEDQNKLSVISKRDFQRKLNIQKQRDIKKLNSAENEKIDFFEQEFSTKCGEIEELLNISESIAIKDRPDHLNTVFKDLLLLQKYVAASNLFLRTYDIKKCNEVLNTLTNKAKELEEKLLPKKKFGFRNKTRVTNNSIGNSNNCGKDEPDLPEISKKLTLLDETSTGFSGRSDEQLCLKSNEVFKKDVRLEGMKNCTVKIFGTSSTLHLNQLKNCIILCGPVSTSIFASNCDDCELVIACQQLRLHSSKHVKIYLHVTSRAIMEDCTDIMVAPYNWKYEGIEQDFERSGLDNSFNNWQGIDDFNWLKANEHSPNWSVLEEVERKHWS
ncbi:hypothetical protein WA026_012501 [Henosepilachna vigintioctopunctata]|uniref:C-CAP/cofactor C-like domain-containing protein n=1 Tax=Henosepilachna vigintioctopunctata TaxID=420089 RepID=A0AAW1UQI7_9CUCU